MSLQHECVTHRRRGLGAIYHITINTTMSIGGCTPCQNELLLPNFKASDLGMLVVAVGRAAEVALLAAKLCMDSW